MNTHLDDITAAFYQFISLYTAHRPFEATVRATIWRRQVRRVERAQDVGLIVIRRIASHIRILRSILRQGLRPPHTKVGQPLACVWAVNRNKKRKIAWIVPRPYGMYRTTIRQETQQERAWPSYIVRVIFDDGAVCNDTSAHRIYIKAIIMKPLPTVRANADLPGNSSL